MIHSKHFGATLILQNIKVAPKPLDRIFLNFLKKCIACRACSCALVRFQMIKCIPVRQPYSHVNINTFSSKQSTSTGQNRNKAQSQFHFTGPYRHKLKTGVGQMVLFTGKIRHKVQLWPSIVLSPSILGGMFLSCPILKQRKKVPFFPPEGDVIC